MIPTQAVRFRDATAADLPSLVALDAICFSPQTRYSHEVMRFFAFHRNSKAVVAIDDHSAVTAFIIVHLLRSGIGEVVTIDVAPEHRRKGIARELMNRGERWLRERGAKGIFLEVDADNDSAIALYEKFGYQVRQPFLENDRRRLLMEKGL